MGTDAYRCVCVCGDLGNRPYGGSRGGKGRQD